MKKLNITVANKVATYSQRDGFIVCGNSDYQITFTFDSEWNEYAVKTARFKWNDSYTDVVFEGNIVNVPIIQGASQVEVGVFTGNICTSTPAIIPCVRSILCGDGVPVEPTPDVYSQIIDLLNNSEVGKYDYSINIPMSRDNLMGTINGYKIYKQTDKTYPKEKLLGAILKAKINDSNPSTRFLKESHLKYATDLGLVFCVEEHLYIYVVYSPEEFSPWGTSDRFSSVGIYSTYIDPGDPYEALSLTKDGLVDSEIIKFILFEALKY